MTPGPYSVFLTDELSILQSEVAVEAQLRLDMSVSKART